MPRPIPPAHEAGLPTSRQRALVLLVMTNAGSSWLHPITGICARLRGMVPMPVIWTVLADLIHHGWAIPERPRDPSAGFALTANGRGQAVREVEAEITRERGVRETSLLDDATLLGLVLPYRDIYHPPPRDSHITNIISRNGGTRGRHA